VCNTLPCQAPRAVAACGSALLAWHEERYDRAEEWFEVASELVTAVDMPLARAEVMIGCARFLRHAGRVEDARLVLRDALDVLEGTGAGRLERVAREELLVAGGRRRARSGSELTVQEGRIVDLAARGLTNAEIARQLFVSPKTVDHHLSRAYQKLGVRSRRELMLRYRSSNGEDV